MISVIGNRMSGSNLIRMPRVCLILYLFLVFGLPRTWATEYTLVIVAGQSNAVGYGTNAQQLTPDTGADTEIRYYADGGNGSWGWGSLRAVGGKFGPEMTFGRALHDSGIEDLAIVKVASNGSNLYRDWEKDNPDGLRLYAQLVDRVREAVAALEALEDGNTVKIAAIVWMQGETDAKSARTDSGGGLAPPPQPQTAEQYGENLEAFWSNLRSDLEAPDLRLLLGRLGSLGTGPQHLTGVGYYEYLETVQAEQVALAESDPRIEWVDTSDLALNADHLHFTSASMETLGARFAEAYFRSPSYSFATWVQWSPGFFRPELLATDAGEEDDADGDGLSNLVEFACGLDPTRGDAGLLPGATRTEGEWQCSVPRNTQAQGIEVTFEASADLMSWESIESFGATFEAIDDAWRLHFPPEAAGWFVRLEVKTL